jgi:hypothetical protein
VLNVRRLSEVQRAVEWRAEVEAFAVSIQPGGEIDRELADSEQQIAGAQQRVGELMAVREQRVRRLAAARQL